MKLSALISIAILFAASPALAANTGNSGADGFILESIIAKMHQSISLKIINIISVIAIVAAGLILVVGGTGTVARISVSLVLGMSLALAVHASPLLSRARRRL